MVGDLTNMKEITNLLLPYFMDSESMFVISNDFCHWGERFEYTPTAENEPIYRTIQKLNYAAFESLKQQTVKWIYKIMA